MIKFINALPIIIFLLLTLIVNISVRHYFINLGLTPKDSYVVTMISTISYLMGVLSISIYYRYR